MLKCLLDNRNLIDGFPFKPGLYSDMDTDSCRSDGSSHSCFPSLKLGKTQLCKLIFNSPFFFFFVGRFSKHSKIEVFWHLFHGSGFKTCKSYVYILLILGSVAGLTELMLTKENWI